MTRNALRRPWRAAAALLLLLGVLAVGTRSAEAAPSSLTVTPNVGLTAPATVTLSWTGGTPLGGASIVECDRTGITGPQSATYCDTSNFLVVTSDASGNGTVTMSGLHTGAMGTAGNCVSTCYIAIADFAQGPVFTFAPITFGPAPEAVLTSSPSHARVGDAVTLEGSDWGASLSDSSFSVELCDSSETSCGSAALSSVTVSTDATGAMTGSVVLADDALSGHPPALLRVTQTGGDSATSELHVLADRSISAAPSSAGAGSTVTISGSDYDPSQAVTVSLLDSSMTPVANATGVASVDGHGVVSGSFTVESDDGLVAFVSVAEDDNPSVEFAQTAFTMSANDCAAPCDLAQNVELDVLPGFLSMAQDAAVVTMTPITLDGSTQTSTGDLNDVTVLDARGTLVGWSLTATMTDLVSAPGGANRTIPANNLSWIPSCDAVDGNASEVQAGSPGVLDTVSATALCVAPAGGGGGTFSADASLALEVPAYVAVGSYQGTLTLTIV